MTDDKPRRGRPPVADPKVQSIGLRVNHAELATIDAFQEAHGLKSRSDAMHKILAHVAGLIEPFIEETDM